NFPLVVLTAADRPRLGFGAGIDVAYDVRRRSWGDTGPGLKAGDISHHVPECWTGAMSFVGGVGQSVYDHDYS
ncbi:hypothetical protein, partial [Nonomuraea sp. NPDC003201]